MSKADAARAVTTSPGVEPPQTGADDGVATPSTPEHEPAPEEDAPGRQEDELRCTLCGLRACWTA